MSYQIILELDADTARELESVAPSRARKRSEFIRRALREALDRAAEARMREAYQRLPDRTEPSYFDAEAWDRPAASAARRTRSRRR